MSRRHRDRWYPNKDLDGPHTRAVLVFCVLAAASVALAVACLLF